MLSFSGKVKTAAKRAAVFIAAASCTVKGDL